MGVCAVSLAMVAAVNADIGFQITNGSGVFLDGGDFGSGPWPTAPAAFQVVWSLNVPGAPQFELDPSLANAGEFIVGAGPSASYGYVGPTPLIVVTPGDVGGNDPNAGQLYMRIFDSAAPAIGSRYFQSNPIATSGLPVYVPSDPGTQPNLDLNPNASQVNGTVIPEPATVALWGLGLVTILVRRKIRG